jgi:hypothetical protein
MRNTAITLMLACSLGLSLVPKMIAQAARGIIRQSRRRREIFDAGRGD